MEILIGSGIPAGKRVVNISVKPAEHWVDVRATWPSLTCNNRGVGYQVSTFVDVSFPR